MTTIAQAAARPAMKKMPWIACLPLLALPWLAVLLGNRMAPWAFMWMLSFAIFAGLKWMTWWRARKRVLHTGARSLAYLLAWPGMDAETFLGKSPPPACPRAQDWLSAALKTLFGVALLWAVARQIPSELLLLRGWVGLLGLIFLLHFGSFQLIALFWQALGVNAQPIMAKPIFSKTLSEFWGKRWNLGFRQLAHEFLFRPVQRRAGATAAGWSVFLASGLIHDLVISLPARAGYGLPTAYFLLQGFGVAFERSAMAQRIGLQKELAARIFTIMVTAAPAFGLFHPPFLGRVILPFLHAIRAL